MAAKREDNPYDADVLAYAFKTAEIHAQLATVVMLAKLADRLAS